MSMFDGFRAFRSGGDNSAPRGNTNSNQNSNQNNNNNNQNNNNNNNNDNNNQQSNPEDMDFTRDNMWRASQQDNSNSNNNNNNSNNQNNNSNNNNNQQTAEQAFDEYMNKLGLGVELTPEMMQKFKDEGDFAGLSEALLKGNKKLYGQMMRDTSRLIDAGVSRAVEKAMEKFNATTTTNNLIGKMNKALPFTENPNVAPFAQAALSQALKIHKGDAEKAIGQVKGFFAAMTRMSARDLNINPDASPNSNRFGGRGNNNSEDVDWMAFLSADDG